MRCGRDVATAVRDDARAARPRGGVYAGGVSDDRAAAPAARRSGAGRRRVGAGERKWLAEFVATVRARHADVVHDVIIYGSKARGDWHDHSEIDVLVIVVDGAAEGGDALRHLALPVPHISWAGL